MIDNWFCSPSQPQRSHQGDRIGDVWANLKLNESGRPLEGLLSADLACKAKYQRRRCSAAAMSDNYTNSDDVLYFSRYWTSLRVRDVGFFVFFFISVV